MYLIKYKDTKGSCLTCSFVLYICNNLFYVWIPASDAGYFTILKLGGGNIV